MRRKDLADRLASIHRLVDKLDRSVERIEIVTVVREPNTALAADAYNGLRKQVIAATSERNAHLYQLTEFDAALRAGATPEELATLVREWMGQASIDVVEDLDLEGAFQVVGPDNVSGCRVMSPAYLDRVTNRIVRAGIAERFVATVATAEPEPLSAAPEPSADGIPSPSEGEQ